MVSSIAKVHCAATHLTSLRARRASDFFRKKCASRSSGAAWSSEPIVELDRASAKTSTSSSYSSPPTSVSTKVCPRKSASMTAAGGSTQPDELAANSPSKFAPPSMAPATWAPRRLERASRQSSERTMILAAVEGSMKPLTIRQTKGKARGAFITNVTPMRSGKWAASMAVICFRTAMKSALMCLRTVIPPTSKTTANLPAGFRPSPRQSSSTSETARSCSQAWKRSKPSRS
mmetsp:Transcript_26803/g.92508  ORF Transcript_26803/g.92508 Transcript_26803/m.92508 type:complete len:232 (+) Transcript_26803:961-1656(+)